MKRIFQQFMDANDAGGGGGKTFTQDEVNALVGERLARERDKFKDYDELQKKATKLDEQERANQTETDRLKADLAAATKAGADRISKAQALLLKAEVKAAAAELGVVDSDAAYALMNRSGVKVNDDDTVTGVKESLESLLAAKPYLKGAPSPRQLGQPLNPGDPNPGTANPWKKESLNYTEQGAIYRRDPALAERLKAEAKG